MKLLTATIVVIALAASVARGEPLSNDVVNKLKEVIKKECPDAEFEVEGDTFTAKRATMMFTLHGRWKTGEITSKTHQQEGPNYKGFLLHVTSRRGREVYQLVTPQTMREPYWSTYINNPPTPDGKDHYWVSFSYGSRLDEKVKAAVHEAISSLSENRLADSDTTEENASPAGKAK